jgi:DNA mismatch repair protein MutS2
MKVPLKDIVGVDHTEPASFGKAGTAGARSRAITVHAEASGAPVAEEINVIGCTVEEATERVDKFLDRAVLAGKPTVRIIHGHGTGALRRGLAEFLSSHPLVERTHAEAEDRGGTAITVAELKS